MTAGEVVTRVRGQLQDEFLPYRWKDAEILKHLSGALQEVARRRPDLAADTDWTQQTVADVTSTADTLVYDESVRDALVYGTAERIYLTEDPDRGNVQQAQTMRANFEQQLFI